MFVFRKAVTLLAVSSAAGQGPIGNYAPATELPRTRVIDTYAIYSQLLPGDHIEWGNVARTQWLVEQTTASLPLGISCEKGGSLNPHQAIQAPAGRSAELAELLMDYDAHCHTSFVLKANHFHLPLPVRILDEQEQARFEVNLSGYRPPSSDMMRAPPEPDEFRGAAGLHSFSAVYFNRSHRVAMTMISMYCGSLCGNRTWVVLEKTRDGWRSLRWPTAHVIS